MTIFEKTIIFYFLSIFYKNKTNIHTKNILYYYLSGIFQSNIYTISYSQISDIQYTLFIHYQSYYINNIMNSQNQYIIRQLEISELITQQPYYNKLIKILIQTLANLGYKQSAMTLEKESLVKYFDEDVELLQQLLEQPELRIEQINKQFEKVFQGLDQSTQQQIRVNLLQIEIGDLYRKMVQGTLSQQIQQKILSRIHLFDQIITSSPRRQDMEKRMNEIIFNFIFAKQPSWLKQRNVLVQAILKKCEKSGIENHSMEKIIQFYIEKKLMDSVDFNLDALADFSLINHEANTIEPPENQFYFSKSTATYEITFLKINFAENKVITGGNSKKYSEPQSQIILWDLNAMYQNYQNDNKNDQVIAKKLYKVHIAYLCWNYTKEASQEIIGVAFRDRITLFDNKLEEKSVIKINSVLCCQFNPFTNFLYTAGLSRDIKVWDQNMELLEQFNFHKVRQLVFTMDGVYGFILLATENKIIKVSTSNLQEMQSIIFQKKVIQITLAEQRDLLIITTHEIIYLVSISKFEINDKVNLPQYNQEKQYYLYSKYLSPWIINFHKKNYYAWNLNQIKSNSKLVRPKEINMKAQYPIFDVLSTHQNIKIVSSQKTSISLWKIGNEERMMVNSDLSNEIQIEQEQEDHSVWDEQQQLEERSQEESDAQY